MTGTVLWLLAIAFIVIGLLVYFYGVVNEEKRKATRRQAHNALEDDAKELVVNSLTSPDPYQRQAMAKQLAAFETVDDVIVQLLQEMAVGDDDEAVRKTAVSTLKTLNK